MKPCTEYKEWIALAVLEGEHSQRAAALPEIEAPTRLNARVRDAISREASLCCGIEIRASLRRLLQGMGIAAAAAIIVVMLVQLSARKPTSLPPTAKAPTPGVSETTSLAEPTFAAYHHRLTRSVEELEASLADYGAVSGGEVLKASSAIDIP